MIEYIKKDITTVETGVVAHGVNCQGKMNAGVAKAIRAKWPEVYTSYASYCIMWNDHPDHLLGQCHIVKTVSTDETLFGSLYVANLFTQLNYGREKKVYASVEAVYKAVEKCMIFCQYNELPLYMPRIGSGLGGLDWDTDVLPIVEKHANTTNVDVHICDL